MGLLDRVKRSGRGVPGRAVVVVNRSGGAEPGSSSVRRLLRARLRPLPDGSGPENDISQLLPSHHVALITAGMEIPALLDPDTHAPTGVAQEGLDEAIGRYYLGLEPEHGSWEGALEAQRKELGKVEGTLGDIRHGVDQVKDVAAAARALPGGLRNAVKEWKTELKELGNEQHPAGPPVEGVSFDAWVEVRAGLVRDAVPAADEGPYAEKRGIPPGRWDAVNSHWEQQVKWNTSARALYDEAMAEGTRRTPTNPGSSPGSPS